MATSYNNWQASDSASAIGIDTHFAVDGFTFPGGVKSGDVSAIFTYLIHRLHTEVEPLHAGWNWGWEYRANVNNPSVLSCHASGTAIDYNAPNHANGTSVGPQGGGGWSARQYAQIKQILIDCGNVITWLTNNDPMHFEISGSAAQVAAAVRNLGQTPTPPTNPDTPDQPEEGDDDLMGYSPEQLTQFASSGFARAAEQEVLKGVGDGPNPGGQDLTLIQWMKIQNDRIWHLENDPK